MRGDKGDESAVCVLQLSAEVKEAQRMTPSYGNHGHHLVESFRS